MKKASQAARLDKALAEIETLKAQVAALQMQVAALTQPVVPPYQPFVPYTQPRTWPPQGVAYVVTCGGGLPPHPGHTIQSLDAARMVRGVS
jgi:hypothetical protein